MAWPKGRPRKVVASEDEAAPKASKREWKFKVKPNWETMTPGDDTADRFHIPREEIPEGFDLQWVTDTVYGEPQRQLRQDFERKGWTPMHQDDFDGRFDGKFMPKGQEGEINNGGQVLMYRPIELTIEARKKDLRRAREQIAIKEAALRGGNIPGVSFDTQHESVHNKVSRSWEAAVAVPKDE